ncbi:Protein ArsC [Blastochloris viridis]|nr:Protein ArsC [Blastochloris viridis]CUU42286.1 Arsenate reductase [Blastochloris viridis]
MESDDALLALSALAQATRLEVFRLLMAHEPNGLAAGEVSRCLAVPANTLSAHLAILARAGLVTASRRSRSIVYRARPDSIHALVGFLVEDCCGGHAELCTPTSAPPLRRPAAGPLREGKPMPDRIFNVLFLCTGNTARSILAESILTKDGGGRFRAFSAGSQPKGTVNPFALKVLAAEGYPTEGLHSKSWAEFAAADAPVMDFVFTVCDNAAGEACPVWPGQPMTAHWGIEDPAAASGNDVMVERAFVTALRYLKNRISVFTALPFASLDRLALGSRLREIGRLEGATGRKAELA